MAGQPGQKRKVPDAFLPPASKSRKTQDNTHDNAYDPTTSSLSGSLIRDQTAPDSGAQGPEARPLQLGTSGSLANGSGEIQTTDEPDVQIPAARPLRSTPRPYQLRGECKSILSDPTTLQKYEEDRKWKPELAPGEDAWPVDEDEWFTRLYNAAVETGTHRSKQSLLMGNHINKADAEYGIHNLLASLKELYTDGVNLHPIADPTVDCDYAKSGKNKGKIVCRTIDEDARNMPALIRLPIIEQGLLTDKALCDTVLLATDTRSLHKDICASPESICAKRKETQVHNDKRRTKTDGPAQYATTSVVDAVDSTAIGGPNTAAASPLNFALANANVLGPSDNAGKAQSPHLASSIARNDQPFDTTSQGIAAHAVPAHNPQDHILPANAEEIAYAESRLAALGQLPAGYGLINGAYHVQALARQHFFDDALQWYGTIGATMVGEGHFGWLEGDGNAPF